MNHQQTQTMMISKEERIQSLGKLLLETIMFLKPEASFQELVLWLSQQSNITAETKADLTDLLAAMEDNDFKAFSMHSKANAIRRGSLNENLVADLAELTERFEVTENNAKTGFLIRDIVKDETYEYFPKSSRICKRAKGNQKVKWFDFGHNLIRNWIKENKK